jgi:YD repeat-containing protein
MPAIVAVLFALAAAASPAAMASGRRVAPVALGHASAAHAAPPRAHAARHGPAIRPRLAVNPRALRRAKSEAARRYRRARGRRRPGRTPPPVRQRASVFGGLNWQGVTESGSSPPDTTGAIGPSHYVETTNDGVRVYARADGSQVSSAALDSFLGVPGHDVTDPQILWDQTTGRWYYAAIDIKAGSEQLLFGWSKTSDPSDLASGWCPYSIATTGFIDDFPKLGDDNGHISVGVNRFQATGAQNFVSAFIYAIDKPGAGATCGPSPTFARFPATTPGETTFTPVPANSTDSSGAGYVVSATGGSSSHIGVWHVGGAPGSPTLTRDGAIPVSAFGVPANAPQAGSSNLLDTSDTRLTQAVAHVDPATGTEAIWTQHTVDGAGGRAVVRWYELIPSTLSARQTGTLADSSDFLFNAAISPTNDGASAVIDYNASGPSSRPSIIARSRRPATPSGQMGLPVTLVSSIAPLDDGTCSPCRWGDYAGATPDPQNAALVWGTNEYSTGGGLWTTRNFALDVGGGGPVASFTATPATVDTGQPVSFDGSGTTGSNGVAVVSYEWDLDGDGTFETGTGSSPQVSRTYGSPATVTVGLRVTDAAGDQSVAQRTVTVRNRPPTAVIALSSPTVAIGRTVSLDGSASSDPDGHITRYQWDLDGDGTFETDTGSSAVTPSRPFAAPLVVTVRLRVTDDRGATADATAPLTVFRPPPPPPTKKCLAARASVKKLSATVHALKRQLKRTHNARKRKKLQASLRLARRRLATARTRVLTLC